MFARRAYLIYLLGIPEAKKVILSLLVGYYITKALTSRIELAYSVTLYVLKNLLRTLFSYLEQKRILRIRII